MYIPELFEMTWKSTHAKRVASTDRLRMENVALVEQPTRWMLHVLRTLRSSHRQSRLEVCANKETVAAGTAVPRNAA